MSRNQSHSCLGWKGSGVKNNNSKSPVLFLHRAGNFPNPSRYEIVSLSQRGLLFQPDEKMYLCPHLSPPQLGNQSSDMVWRSLWSSCSHSGCVGLCDTSVSVVNNVTVIRYISLKQHCFQCFFLSRATHLCYFDTPVTERTELIDVCPQCQAFAATFLSLGAVTWTVSNQIKHRSN